jgi:membrane protein YqaA with SNARE-associated domain
VKAILATFVVCFGSAMLPFINAEVYFGAVATSVSRPTGIVLAIAGTLGQVAGKVVWYVLAARASDSKWVQKKLAKPKWQARHDRWQASMQGRPWWAFLIILCSASVGFPPLLLMAVVAGTLRMNFPLYVIACLIGRAVRFLAIVLGVGLFFL